MPRSEGPEHPDGMDERRRARAIEQLAEKAAASPDPIGWVRDFTLRALRAPSLGSLPTADRADARREIHAIGREVSGALSRTLTKTAKPSDDWGDGPDPSEQPRSR